MTDKEKIRAEIKELYNSIDLCISDLVKGRTEHNDVQVANAHHKMESLMVQTQQVLSCVSDTFEEPVSEDLEEEIDKYTDNQANYLEYNDGWEDSNDIEYIEKAARHFANWQKEQMMKDSIEYSLYADGDFITIDHDFSKDGYKEGDKVKLIIVKEAEK